MILNDLERYYWVAFYKEHKSPKDITVKAKNVFYAAVKMEKMLENGVICQDNFSRKFKGWGLNETITIVVVETGEEVRIKKVAPYKWDFAE